ncbi:MAG: dihydroorotase family protein [Treponema sp.]|nr:dihydroorotase family protein [Treponema sp.]
MKYDLILQNGTIVTPNESFEGDVVIHGGKIIKVGKFSDDTADVIYDASGKHILPGVIDAHVHFRDPGLTEKEDFETGSIAAAMGGVTMIADMPNTNPVTSTAESFNEKLNIAREKSYIDFALFALLNEDNFSEMDRLKNSGALGYKIFFGSSTGDIAAPTHQVLIQQMKKASEQNMRIGFHAELNEINTNFTGIAKKETDDPDGFWLDYARPVASEANAIHSIINYAFNTKTKIHIHHITSEDGTLLTEKAKQEGIDVTTETCPHYLIFDCNEHNHKVYPPIRDESHREALWNAVQNKIIDMIASDHAPHTAEQKAVSGWEKPGGLCGVETLVPILLNEVNKGEISINDFVRLTSENPAKIWGIYPQKGNLNPGADACITIVDMNMKKTIKTEDLHSKSKTSPYDGMELQGFPVAAIVRGKFVMKDGVLTGRKGYGVLVNQK